MNSLTPVSSSNTPPTGDITENNNSAPVAQALAGEALQAVNTANQTSPSLNPARVERIDPQELWQRCLRVLEQIPETKSMAILNFVKSREFTPQFGVPPLELLSVIETLGALEDSTLLTVIAMATPRINRLTPTAEVKRIINELINPRAGIIPNKRRAT